MNPARPFGIVAVICALAAGGPKSAEGAEPAPPARIYLTCHGMTTTRTYYKKSAIDVAKMLGASDRMVVDEEPTKDFSLEVDLEHHLVYGFDTAITVTPWLADQNDDLLNAEVGANPYTHSKRTRYQGMINRINGHVHLAQDEDKDQDDPRIEHVHTEYELGCQPVTPVLPMRPRG